MANAYGTINTLEGTLILGTDSGCGKTTVTAGLTAAIMTSGFRVQAFKPLVFCPEVALNPTQEQVFINKITQQYIHVDTITAPSPWELTMPLWNRMIEQCKQLQYPCFLEAPGQVATPWQILDGRITDGPDVAQQLGLSVLLVAEAGGDFLEKTRSALNFLHSRNIEPLGFIRVQTTPDSRDLLSPQEPFLLAREQAVPFLGDLPYSPSISVAGLQQGNLIRLIQENIDLLPLQVGMGLTL